MFDWVTVGDVLLLRAPGQEDVTPAAADVYTFAFGASEQLGQFPSLPATLSYQRTPLELRIRFTTRATRVSLDVVAVSEHVRHSLASVRERAADHVVTGTDWYPIAAGDLEHVRGILSRIGLESGSPVSLGQYVALLREPEIVGYLDATDEELSKIERALVDGYEAPECLSNIPLYPYQLDGFKWLALISANGVGGLLADEMGLGKTAQLLALLLHEASASRIPALVVAPLTIQENWAREARLFAPGLRVQRHLGRDRAAFSDELLGSDVVLTSYDTLARDISMFRQVRWNVVVLDEVQAIRNPQTRRSRLVKSLKRRVSIACTGTPVQNRLLDLWSIMDFATPGLLGGENYFVSTYDDVVEDARRLRHLTAPLILRRRVADVAQDLPERVVVPQRLEMDSTSAEEYEQLRQNAVATGRAGASLAILSNLRMYCAHPFLLEMGEGDLAAYSRKYERLVEILEEILESEEKCLIFTGYRRMIDLIVDDLPRRFGAPAEWIDGRTPAGDRQPTVDRFSSSKGGGVLVLNPMAAGVGLNIASANHVVHYTLEWNPATEDQASARAYRRGQLRPVTIHRMFYVRTIEEAIDDRLSRKRDLAAEAVSDARHPDERGDILRALTLSPLRAAGS